MKKTKTFIFLLSFVFLFSARPAFAVVELIKVLQYSLRNVQAVIEVVKNGIALGTSIQQTTLQGTIGAVAPKVANMGSLVEGKSFVPKLPTDLQSIASKGLKAVPEMRSYVDKELKSINLGDGVSQRDILHKVTEMQNLSAVGAVKLAKEAMAKSNKAPSENKQQLSAAGGASDMQAKVSQETGVAIKSLKNDTSRNQLSANLLQAKAMHYKADAIKANKQDESKDKKAEDSSFGVGDLLDKVGDVVNGSAINDAKSAVQSKVDAVINPYKGTATNVGNVVQKVTKQIK